jgi:hypothetical protein
MGMAALLMPRGLFGAVAGGERAALELPDFPLVAGSIDTDRLVGRIATRFEVSRQAAEIRLRTLGLTVDASVRALGLTSQV